MTQGQDGPDEVYRITGALPSRSADLDRRVTRYLISMGIRTACVVLVFVIPGPAKWVFGVGAVFLPYVAVIFANAGNLRTEAGPAPVEHRGLTTADSGETPSSTAPPAPERQVLQGQVLRSRHARPHGPPTDVPGPAPDR